MNDERRRPRPYKTCVVCHQVWPSLLELVSDPALEVVGYQPMFEDPAAGLFLVVHQRAGCLTTIAIRAGDLQIFYEDSIPGELLAGTAACPRLCLSSHELATCRNPCRMAWVRQVLQYLRRHELPAHLADRADG